MRKIWAFFWYQNLWKFENNLKQSDQAPLSKQAQTIFIKPGCKVDAGLKGIKYKDKKRWREGYAMTTLNKSSWTVLLSSALLSKRDSVISISTATETVVVVVVFASTRQVYLVAFEI